MSFLHPPFLSECESRIFNDILDMCQNYRQKNQRCWQMMLFIVAFTSSNHPIFLATGCQDPKDAQVGDLGERHEHGFSTWSEAGGFLPRDSAPKMGNVTPVRMINLLDIEILFFLTNLVLVTFSSRTRFLCRLLWIFVLMLGGSGFLTPLAFSLPFWGPSWSWALVKDQDPLGLSEPPFSINWPGALLFWTLQSQCMTMVRVGGRLGSTCVAPLTLRIWTTERCPCRSSFLIFRSRKTVFSLNKCLFLLDTGTLC